MRPIDLAEEDLLKYFCDNISTEALVIKKVFAKWFIVFVTIVIVTDFTLWYFDIYQPNKFCHIGLIGTLVLLYILTTIRAKTQLNKMYIKSGLFHWKTEDFDLKQCEFVDMAISRYDFDLVYSLYNKLLINNIGNDSITIYFKPAMFLALITPLWAVFLKRQFDLARSPNEVLTLFAVLIIICLLVWCYFLGFQLTVDEIFNRKKSKAKRLLDILNIIKEKKDKANMFKCKLESI